MGVMGEFESAWSSCYVSAGLPGCAEREALQLFLAGHLSPAAVQGDWSPGLDLGEGLHLPGSQGEGEQVHVLLQICDWGEAGPAGQ